MLLFVNNINNKNNNIFLTHHVYLLKFYSINFHNKRI